MFFTRIKNTAAVIVGALAMTLLSSTHARAITLQYSASYATVNTVFNYQYYYPLSVAVGSNGNVYATYFPPTPNTPGAYSNSIATFNPNNFSATFTTFGAIGTDKGQLEAPEGIAVGSDGNVYVADTGNNRIDIFNSTGTFITSFGNGYGSGIGQFEQPRGVAVGSNGNVYVADTGNDRIDIFNPNNFINTFSSFGNFDGFSEFHDPMGIAVDYNNNVYVADTENNRIAEFNSTGTFISSFGTQGSGKGQFYYPFGVAVDGNGNVYVADTFNNRIDTFNTNNFSGTFASFSSQTNASNAFGIGTPGIAVDSNGNVYLDGTNRIDVLSPVNTQPVPEPSTILGTLATSGIGMGLRRKQKLQ